MDFLKYFQFKKLLKKRKYRERSFVSCALFVVVVKSMQTLVSFIDWFSNSAICQVRTPGPHLKKYTVLYLKASSKIDKVGDKVNKYYLR